MTKLSWFMSASFALMLVATVKPTARGDLFEYVKRPEPRYEWSVTRTDTVPAGTVTQIKMTSQVWQEIPWVHKLRIYDPATVKYPDATLLFITGGSHTSEPSQEDHEMGFGLANLCGARVAVLPQVPNQPLLGDKTEDTLIAETFVRYLETQDENWPLLFPMAKSAVKAMDTVEAWAKKEGKSVPKKFVVTGASKRGWTTWLTGAVDPRVVAIAPMVIDTLNMKAQRAHYLEAWGKYSEQIDDYANRGLTEKFDDPVGKKLWKMVDPYTHLDRVTMPKFLINGANDEYWTLDALNIYWDDLQGQKSVVYLPNAGHGLSNHRDYALNGIGAFFRHNISNRPWPVLTWKHTDGDNGGLVLTVKSNPEPKSARLWVAKGETRDFRKSTWEEAPMVTNGAIVKGEAAKPDSGFIAIMGDLEYEVDGIPYHLSTQIRQVGAKPAK